MTRISDASGLVPNKTKSECIFCNVPSKVISENMCSTGFSRCLLPIKYLGIPWITSKIRAQNCASLVHRLCSKLNSWSSRFLHFSGRLQLLKSVLAGIQGYWASHLFLPKCIISKIQSLLAKFLWGGKSDANCHLNVAWRDCCLPKTEGGIGLHDLFERNKTSILLQVWRLSHPIFSSMWVQWVHQCLLKNKAFWIASISYSTSWAFK